jgi:hypothetical protein
MKDFNELNDEFTMVINKSFDGAFQHYKERVLKVAKEAGATAPVVFVLELERNKIKDSDLTSIDIQGKSYVPDVNPLRDYIKKLGLEYIKNIHKHNSAIPSAIIIASEVWVQEKKATKGKTVKHEPLQDKDGKSINGSVEKFMISGMTATDTSQFAIYDIIRNKKGNITDFVLDEHASGLLMKGQAMILQSFYTTMAEYLQDKITKQFEGWSL